MNAKEKESCEVCGNFLDFCTCYTYGVVIQEHNEVLPIVTSSPKELDRSLAYSLPPNTCS